MRIRIAGLSLLALATTATLASARFHARLVRAEPGVDAVVNAAPRTVRLWFNQPVSPRLTTATVLTADSTKLATVTFAATSDSLSVAGPLAATLGAGRYRVQWRSMSADGHAIRGEYVFRLQP